MPCYEKVFAECCGIPISQCLLCTVEAKMGRGLLTNATTYWDKCDNTMKIATIKWDK